MKNTTLITRDSKGKIRVVEVSYESTSSGYVIHRTTYQYRGKQTEQPDIEITKGKAKRTLLEQVELEYASYLKKYQDKGYKLIPGDISQYKEEDLNKILPEHTTDANGFKKHMLAKQSEKVATSTFDKLKYWWASRKIDGTRCSFYWDGFQIKTASRGGGNYNMAVWQMIEHPQLIKFFKEHPDYILDGELYKHGKSLQQISGAVRKEKESTPWLEYYIYDVMIPDMIFEERLKVLNEIKEELELDFQPEREWEENELKFQMVPHEKVTGWNAIKKLHDAYVEEGWEGCVIRDPNKAYKFGGRSSEMIKVKMYQDAEFEITGLSEGLREEDMCFTLVTDDGIEFKAKPMGSRELKQQYREDLDNLIGKMATVKFFYLSDEGTPLQPVLKCIRDYE